MIRTFESLTASNCAHFLLFSHNGFQLAPNPDVTHCVYFFHHILPCAGEQGERAQFQ